MCEFVFNLIDDVGLKIQISHHDNSEDNLRPWKLEFEEED